jgi:Bacterial protein of unknown function (DUF924)
MSTNEGFEDVLRFWFSSLPHGDHAAMARQMEWWFRGGADSEIVERFPPLLDRAQRGDLDSWSDSPRSRLALIIVILTRAPSRDRSSVRAGSESSRPCSRRDRERSLRGARNTLGENLLLLASRPLRGSHKSGASGEARGGTRQRRPTRASRHARVLSKPGPWAPRHNRTLRPSSSPQRSPGAAINSRGTRLSCNRPTRPHPAAAKLAGS